MPSASDILYMKKQRRRLTLNRNFVGDYIGFDTNPALRALVGGCNLNFLGEAANDCDVLSPNVSVKVF